MQIDHSETSLAKDCTLFTGPRGCRPTQLDILFWFRLEAGQSHLGMKEQEAVAAVTAMVAPETGVAAGAPREVTDE
jgi:hypothetical protein